MSQKRKHFKFRHVNELVGSFVLVAAVVVVIAVILAARVQGWMAPTDVIHIRFPEEGALGVKSGAEVWLMNTVVGSVDWVKPGSDGVMEAGLRVRREYMQFVKDDSEAVVKRKFELAGDIFVEIKRGYGDPLEGDEFTIPIRKDTEFLEQVEIAVDGIVSRVETTLDVWDENVSKFGAFADEMADENGHLQQFLAKMETAAEGIAEGKGSLGELINNDVYVRELDGVLTLMDNRLVELGAILRDLKYTTGALPAMAETLGDEIQEMPGLVLRGQGTLEEAKRLVKGLQKNFLVRKFIEQPKTTGRISPFELPEEAEPLP